MLKESEPISMQKTLIFLSNMIIYIDPEYIVDFLNNENNIFKYLTGSLIEFSNANDIEN